MTPKVVVFDLGKVLVDFDFSIAARRIAASSRLPVDEVGFFDGQAPLLLRYELGQINTRQFYEEICKVTAFTGTEAEFSEYFADIFTPIQPMIDLHATVRRKGVPTYIFSNTNALAIGHISKRFSFFGGFDGYIYSYDHGAMKPDARLYEVVERQTKRRGPEILYVDDRLENVEAGAGRGWQAVLHEAPDRTRATLEKLGVLNHA